MTSCHFILRTDASEETGMGHFYRCLTLAKKIEQVGYNSHFVFKYVSERVIEILKQESISFEIIPEGISWEEEILILDKSASQYHLRIVILDNAHLKTFSQLEGFSEYTSSLGEIFKGRVLIDGYKQNSFVGAGINLDLDLIITPYHGEVPSTGHLSNVKFLFGTEYFVFHDDFCRLYNQKKRISEKASKVLVTFGGSDPFSITPHVLEGISSITDRKLEIRVVIGPCFSKSLKEIIRSTITEVDHNWKLVESPDSLASWIYWADVAISSTGSTKYELALLGTPGLFLSIDSAHMEMNSSFEKVEAGWHLGVYNSVTKEQINESLTELLENQSLRKTMAINGMALLDTNGSDRILNAINMEILNVK